MVYCVLVTFTISLCWTDTAAAEDGLLFRIAEDDPNQNSDVVSFVAFAGDGRTVAAAYGRFVGLLQDSRPGQAILWDAKDGTRRFTLHGYADGVSSVAFSPDGKCVAASGYVGDIKLWQVQNGKRVREIVAPGIVSSVAFSPNGRSLAAGLWLSKERGDAGEARIWDVATGAETAHFVGHTDAVRAVAFSPDGSLLATGSMDGSVRMWDLKDGGLRATLFCPEVVRVAKQEAQPAMRKRGRKHEYEPMPSVESVVFSPDGRMIAAAFCEQVIPGKRAGVGVVKLWDATRNEPVAAISHNGNFVAQVCYSPDGTLLATAGGDRAVILWDTTKLQEVSRVSGDAPIAFAPKGNWLVVRDHGATLRLTRVPIRKVKVSVTHPGGRPKRNGDG